jgi:ABC-2 type transport system permease protein
MTYRRTKAVLIKELHHITRDVRSLVMAIAMPFLMLLLYGYALSLDVDHIKMRILDRDQTSTSRSLIRQFQGSRFFEITGYATTTREIEKDINSSAILIAVVIPAGFGADVANKTATQVQLIVDGSDSNTAAIASTYAEGIVKSFSSQLITQDRPPTRPPAPALDARMRVWYNSSLVSRNFIVPGLIGVIMMIIAAQLTSLTIAREWDNGTMEQILSTPLRPAEIVMGKMIAYFIVGLVDSIISVLVGIYIFGVPFRGSVPALAVTTCIFLTGTMFWGIFISAAARTQAAAYQLGMLTSFMPSMLLSGFTFAVDSMPRAIQFFSIFVPARYYITAVKSLFLKGASFALIWDQIVFLLIFTALVFRFAVRKMNQKVA